MKLLAQKSTEGETVDVAGVKLPTTLLVGLFQVLLLIYAVLFLGPLRSLRVIPDDIARVWVMVTDMGKDRSLKLEGVLILVSILFCLAPLAVFFTQLSAGLFTIYTKTHSVILGLSREAEPRAAELVEAPTRE